MYTYIYIYIYIYIYTHRSGGGLEDVVVEVALVAADPVVVPPAEHASVRYKRYNI